MTSQLASAPVFFAFAAAFVFPFLSADNDDIDDGNSWVDCDIEFGIWSDDEHDAKQSIAKPCVGGPDEFVEPANGRGAAATTSHSRS